MSLVSSGKSSAAGYALKAWYALVTAGIISIISWIFSGNARIAILETREQLSAKPLEQINKRLDSIESQLSNINNTLFAIRALTRTNLFP